MINRKNEFLGPAGMAAEPASPAQAPALYGAPLARAVLQRKLQRRALQRRATTDEAGAVHEAAEAGTAGPGESLPYLDTIQQSFGKHDISGVQSHTDAPAQEAAAGMGAEAFAMGNHVAFAGTPSLHTAAHEAAHVVQQRGGISLKGGIGETGDRYEQHADAVADLVVQGRSAESLLNPYHGDTAASGPSAGIQREDHDVADKDVKYGAMDALRDNLTVLSKPKNLYSAKDKSTSNKIAQIPAGKKITVIEKPSGGTFERSWAKVSVTLDVPKTGYVNTKDAIEDRPLEHSGAGVIMADTGPKPEDIAQHMFGDCFLLAALMSLTRRDPGYVRNTLFATNPTKPAETHTLRFHEDKSGDGRGPFTAETVTVQNTVLQTSGQIVKTDGSKMEAGENIGANGAWNWPAIVEKAYTAWPNRGALDKLSGGQGFRASGHLTGEVHNSESLQFTNQDFREKSEQELQQQRDHWKDGIIQALASQKQILTASTQSAPSNDWLKDNEHEGKGGSGEMKVGGIAFGHVYEIVSADQNSIQIRNPWGSYARVNGQVKKDQAVSVLTWKEFLTVMSGWSVKA